MSGGEWRLSSAYVSIRGFCFTVVPLVIYGFSAYDWPSSSHAVFCLFSSFFLVLKYQHAGNILGYKTGLGVHFIYTHIRHSVVCSMESFCAIECYV